jgi:hypothetical protein
MWDCPRSTIDAAFKASIAETTKAALDNLQPLPGFCQVTDEFTGIHIMDNGAPRHFDVKIVSGFSGHIAPGSTPPALGAMFACNPKVDQRVNRFIGEQIDITAMAAVPAIGATAFNILFAAETQATVATVSCYYPYSCFIDEFHWEILSCIRKTPHVAGLLNSCLSERASAGDPLACYDIHKLAILRPLSRKLHVTSGFRKKRVITADTNVCARMKSSAALAYQNVAGNNQLAAILFHAQTFGF